MIRTLSVLLFLSLATRVAAAPQAFAPALALFHTDSVDNSFGTVRVSVNGRGFGSSAVSGSFSPADCGTLAGGSFVVFISNGQSFVTTDVVLWSDVQIVVNLTLDVASRTPLSARVCTPDGQSQVTVGKWQYEHIDVEVTPTVPAFPLAVAVDAATNVWLNEEFHTQLKSWSGSLWTRLTIPQFQDPSQDPPNYIFAKNNPDQPTPLSVLGETIFVDAQGRVWLTESGSSPYTGIYPNHSRVVMYDPTSQQFRAYNIPGDRNGVFGLAWDAGRNRMWFTETELARTGSSVTEIAYPARLTSFDPDCVGSLTCAGPVYNNYFNFNGNSAKWMCAGGSPGSTTTAPTVGTCVDTSTNTVTTRQCFTNNDCIFARLRCASSVVDDFWCFHEHPIPESAGNYGRTVVPAQVLVHSDGTIWYTSWWGGNHIGRLDPQTGVFQQYPLPAPTAPDPIFGTGPSTLTEKASGNVWVALTREPAIARFNYARRDDPLCLALDSLSGQNPCITLFPLPIDFTAQGPHSTALDGAGNVWVSVRQKLNSKDDCTPRSTIGFAQNATNRILMFPPLYYADSGTCVAVSGARLAYDPTTRGMWFADFFRRRIERIRPLS
jgi:streptogramin lyase